MERLLRSQQQNLGVGPLRISGNHGQLSGEGRRSFVAFDLTPLKCPPPPHPPGCVGRFHRPDDLRRFLLHRWFRCVGANILCARIVVDDDCGDFFILAFFPLKETSQRPPPPQQLLREFIQAPLHEWGRKMGEAATSPLFSLYFR